MAAALGRAVAGAATGIATRHAAVPIGAASTVRGGAPGGGGGGTRSSSARRARRAPAPAPPRDSPPGRNGGTQGEGEEEHAGDGGGVRQRLARYGLGAFAAYGVLSNLNAGVLIVAAWLAAVRRTGATPLDASVPSAAGLFAASYAALYLTSNLMRPVRLSLAIGAAPFFNRFLDGVQRRTRWQRPAAFAALLAAIAVGTVSGIACALAALGGFPQGVPSPAGLSALMDGLKEGVRAAKAGGA